MVRRWVLGLLILALLLALATAIWAKATAPGTTQSGYGTMDRGQTMEQGKMMTGRMPTQMTEHKRCTETCNTVMPYYHKRFASMKTHEGDKQCWATCSKRFGAPGTMTTAAEMKQFWMTKNAEYLRVNQCAQACWRKHHEGKAEVAVAGYRSEPRPAMCGMGEMMH